MAPREQTGQPDLLPQEEVLHLRDMNRQLHAEVARLSYVVARLEADGVRRDQEAATLVLQLQELQQQVGQGTQPVPAVNVVNQAVASTSVPAVGPIVNPAAVFASETFTNPVAAVEAVVVAVAAVVQLL